MRCAYCPQRATVGTTWDNIPACPAHGRESYDVAIALHTAPWVRYPVDEKWARRVDSLTNAVRARDLRGPPDRPHGWRLW